MATNGIPGQVDAYTIFDPGATGRVLLGVCSTLEFVVVAAVAARLYTKHHILKRWTSDDYTCVVAAFATTAYFIVGCIAVTTGASSSISEGRPSTTFLIATWLTQWLSPLAFVFVKLSFFLLYLQIFRPIRALRIAALLGAIYCTLLWGFIFFFRLIVVTPRAGQGWDAVQSDWGAYTNHVLVLVAGPFDIVSNLQIIILPMIGISKLRLSGRQKFGVMAVIMTGLLALIASVISMYYRVGFATNSDTQKPFYATTLCIIVELQIGIFCCSMPAISALIRRHFSSWVPQTRHMTTQSHAYNTSRHTFPDAAGRFSGYSKTAVGTTGDITSTDSDAPWSVPPMPKIMHTSAQEIAAEIPQSYELQAVSIESDSDAQKGKQSSKRASLLSILPVSSRPSPRLSRKSSLNRSSSTWGLRGYFEEHDPNASLGDSILVETHIRVNEEDRG